jgi:hypothetical protein
MTIYHLILADSLEERMVCLRERLAAGEVPLRSASNSGGAAASAASSAAAGVEKDANASLLSKLPAQELLYLLGGGGLGAAGQV